MNAAGLGVMLDFDEQARSASLAREAVARASRVLLPPVRRDAAGGPAGGLVEDPVEQSVSPATAPAAGCTRGRQSGSVVGCTPTSV